MAAGALVGREDVVGGLGGGAHGGADAVTGAAILRGALEYGVDVTGLAGQVAVLADELEAGRQMVEVVTDRRRRHALRQQPERQQQRRERAYAPAAGLPLRSEEHTSELQSRRDIVCRLLLEKKKATVRLPSDCIFTRTLLQESIWLFKAS